jgi:hypothetical protein
MARRLALLPSTPEVVLWVPGSPETELLRVTPLLLW